MKVISLPSWVCRFNVIPRELLPSHKRVSSTRSSQIPIYYPAPQTTCLLLPLLWDRIQTASHSRNCGTTLPSSECFFSWPTTADPILPLLLTNAPTLHTTRNNHMRQPSKQSSGISKELQNKDLFSSHNPIWRSIVLWTPTLQDFGIPNPMMIPSPSKAALDM